MLLLTSRRCPDEMIRMRMNVLVIGSHVRVIDGLIRQRHVCSKRHVSRSADWVLLALGLKSVKLIGKNEVNVVSEPSLRRTILAVRIERLDHVVAASVAVLRVGGEILEVKHKLLTPILDLVTRGVAPETASHPVTDVVRHPGVEFIEVLGDAETIIADKVSGHRINSDRVPSVRLAVFWCRFAGVGKNFLRGLHYGD